MVCRPCIQATQKAVSTLPVLSGPASSGPFFTPQDVVQTPNRPANTQPAWLPEATCATWQAVCSDDASMSSMDLNGAGQMPKLSENNIALERWEDFCAFTCHDSVTGLDLRDTIHTSYGTIVTRPRRAKGNRQKH